MPQKPVVPVHSVPAPPPPPPLGLYPRQHRSREGPACLEGRPRKASYRRCARPPHCRRPRPPTKRSGSASSGLIPAPLLGDPARTREELSAQPRCPADLRSRMQLYPEIVDLNDGPRVGPTVMARTGPLARSAIRAGLMTVSPRSRSRRGIERSPRRPRFQYDEARSFEWAPGPDGEPDSAPQYRAPCALGGRR